MSRRTLNLWTVQLTSTLEFSRWRVKMTPIRAVVLGGVGCVVVLFGAESAVAEDTAAEDTYRSFLEDLEKRAPTAGRNITLPSPDSPTAEVTGGPAGGDEGAAALKNLKEEEALRLNREILERLDE
jgi:hypothetical protein